ncbi:uncharacterized protein LOC131631035 [Vicia villosa]|uniref:uncharacterized protein LOC131631035 n=1 Tax=Vicia villosa TaxID=3911 RepID=UPI00273AF085|nr:uncharacterized protein LOC131631035 [Vicia villosa]
MPTESRRARGRPSKRVSPAAATPPTPAAPPVMESEEPATEPIIKPDAIRINQETTKNSTDSETLKTEKKGNEEPQKFWVDIISGNRIRQRKGLLRTLPIWIKLPQFPLHLWGATNLNKIGSAIGIPLVTNECITHKLRVSYARILVEVDITQKLLGEITITDNEGRKRKQAIEYEWIPKFYERCQKIGHQRENTVQQKVWQPKKKKDEVAKSEQSRTEIEHPEASGLDAQTEDPKMPVEERTMLAAWNIRGLNKADKLREVSSHILKLQPDIIVLIETRVKENKASAIRNKLRLKGDYIDNYCHHGNGRGRNFGRTWKIFIRTNKGPWCAVGDFNNVASSQDRIRGNLVTETKYEDFQAMMDTTGLGEMDSKGEFFTWTNKQANNPIYSRIDRLLANVEWLHTNSQDVLTILPPHVSDHAVLYLTTPRNNYGRRQFRFNNCWVNVVGYMECVERNLTQPARGTPMQKLWFKLKRLKPDLLKLQKQTNDI